MPHAYGSQAHDYEDHYGHMYGDMHREHEHARTVYSDLDHQILDQQYIDESLRQDHYRREHYRQNSTPVDNSRRTHHHRMTREERDARDLVRRGHEESRKHEEDRLHEDEERRHREEERQHIMEEEQRHREEDQRHAQAEEEDKWRKQHELEQLHHFGDIRGIARIRVLISLARL